tara:strand:+ start:731 stop:970 length:240 start_codon:yes stop_codon:yes gene_type:complete
MPRMKISAEMVGFVFTVMIVLASISATYGISQHRLDKHEGEIQDLNTTVKEVNQDVDDNENILLILRRDIEWIRKKLGG